MYNGITLALMAQVLQDSKHNCHKETVCSCFFGVIQGDWKCYCSNRQRM